MNSPSQDIAVDQCSMVKKLTDKVSSLPVGLRSTILVVNIAAMSACAAPVTRGPDSNSVDINNGDQTSASLPQTAWERESYAFNASQRMANICKVDATQEVTQKWQNILDARVREIYKNPEIHPSDIDFAIDSQERDVNEAFQIELYGERKSGESTGGEMLRCDRKACEYQANLLNISTEGEGWLGKDKCDDGILNN